MNKLYLLVPTALATAAWCADADQAAICPDVLPGPVRDAARHELADAAITEVDHDLRDGRDVYRLRYAKDGADHTVTIAADGLVLAHDEADQGRTHEAWRTSKEKAKEAWEKTRDGASDAWVKTKQAVDRDGLTVDTVPPAVRKTLLDQAHGNEITDIDVDAENGKVFYQADVRVKGGRDYSVRVAEDGTLLSENH